MTTVSLDLTEKLVHAPAGICPLPVLPPGLKKHIFIHKVGLNDMVLGMTTMVMMSQMMAMMTLMLMISMIMMTMVTLMKMIIMMMMMMGIMIVTGTWLGVSTLEEQGLLGRPRQRAKWRPSDDDDDDDDDEDVDDDHDDDSCDNDDRQNCNHNFYLEDNS